MNQKFCAPLLEGLFFAHRKSRQKYRRVNILTPLVVPQSEEANSGVEYRTMMTGKNARFSGTGSALGTWGPRCPSAPEAKTTYLSSVPAGVTRFSHRKPVMRSAFYPGGREEASSFLCRCTLHNSSSLGRKGVPQFSREPCSPHNSMLPGSHI